MDSSVAWNPSNGYVAGYILDILKIDSNCESCARLFLLVVTEKHLFVTFKEHDEEKRLKCASEDLNKLVGLLDEKLYAFLEQHGTEGQLELQHPWEGADIRSFWF
ncbi:unnamed protein product [Acanthoscelides obtectus]|uniref:Uncharacterized protein n=1 Tax=Acanthoscelides obtectus TaxID=200917 RepID=A0A9P0LGV9_ACAOB|nr:unnamed protein product [Acanthoscelides obtectus]CAK1640867.1 hypothetical protein AOBTE_LOCUS11983 [Acanthoscelides obtectus]